MYLQAMQKGGGMETNEGKCKEKGNVKSNR